MAEYINRESVRPDEICVGVSCQECPFLKDPINGGCRIDDFIMSIPAADVRPVPEGGIGDLSDVLITVDEIKKMLEDAYNEGVADGKAGVQNRPPLTYDDLLQRNVPTIDPNDFRWELTCKGD